MASYIVLAGCADFARIIFRKLEKIDWKRIGLKKMDWIDWKKWIFLSRSCDLFPVLYLQF